jgi:hypothetical protein
MGTYSRTWKNYPKRQVLTKYTDYVLGFRDTNTAHARDYLISCYGRRRCKKEQREALNTWKMPLYCRPCIVRDATYVDIKSAWYAIMMRVGWDVEFWPNRWLGRGTPPYDFPLPDNKIARSALVSVARSSKIPTWEKGKIVYKPMYNAVENTHVYGLIACVLNGIASVAVDLFNAVYVASDGYIVPSNRAADLITYISDWGLIARAKAKGPAIVGGVGAYWVGDTHSKRPFSYMSIDLIRRDQNLPWLKKKLAYT